MREETLVTNLIRHKRTIEGMLTAMVGNAATAEDLFQETAILMTRLREEAGEDCRFVAWARAIAVNVVRDFRKRTARRPVQFLEDEMLDQVASEFDRDDWEDRRDALRHCAETLPARERRAFELRYAHGEPVAAVAETMAMSRGALDTLLYRIRKTLLQCVEGRLGAAR